MKSFNVELSPGITFVKFHEAGSDDVWDTMDMDEDGQVKMDVDKDGHFLGITFLGEVISRD